MGCVLAGVYGGGVGGGVWGVCWRGCMGCVVAGVYGVCGGGGVWGVWWRGCMGCLVAGGVWGVWWRGVYGVCGGGGVWGVWWRGVYGVCGGGGCSLLQETRHGARLFRWIQVHRRHLLHDRHIIDKCPRNNGIETGSIVTLKTATNKRNMLRFLVLISTSVEGRSYRFRSKDPCFLRPAHSTESYCFT